MGFNNVNVNVSGSQSIIKALQNYNTIIIKPNIVDNRNVLTQEMMSEKHTKYVIRWDYSLEDATINVPKDCIIEFAGGTIDNGTIIGDNTIMIYSKPIDEVCLAERQGTFIYNTTVADEEDITSESGKLKFKDRPVTDGMGRKILRKNIVNGVNTLTQSMISQADTVYVIQYDYVLGTNITIPANCVLEFDGGSISGNYSIKYQKTKLLGNIIIRAHINSESTFGMSQIDVSWFTEPSNQNTQDNSIAINEILQTTKNYTDSIFSYGVTVYIPGGSYYCYNPIVVPNGTRVTVKGDGRRLTRLTAVNQLEFLFGRSIADSTAFDSNSPESMIKVEGITFDGNLRTENVLNLSKCSHSIFIDIEGIGGIYTNLYMNATYTASFYGCYFNSWSTRDVTNISAFLGPSNVNAVSFYSCRFGECNLGVYSPKGNDVCFYNCTFEGCRTAAIMVARTDGLIVNGCYFEQNSTKKDISAAPYDATKFGFRGSVINKDGVDIENVPFEIHADIIINNLYFEDTDVDFLNSKLVYITSNNVHYSNKLKGITIINNVVQRVNSCTADNPYNINIPNDCFVFAMGTKQLNIQNTSMQVIYADEIGGEWRWTNNNYISSLCKIGLYERVPARNIFVLGNRSNDFNIDKVEYTNFGTQQLIIDNNPILLAANGNPDVRCYMIEKIVNRNQLTNTLLNGDLAFYGTHFNVMVGIKCDSNFKVGDVVYIKFPIITDGAFRIVYSSETLAEYKAGTTEVNIAFIVTSETNIINIGLATGTGATATFGVPMINVNNVPIKSFIYYNESGNTSSRPTDPPIGFRYFDTSLSTNGEPIFYAGNSVWVDATGATV